MQGSPAQHRADTQALNVFDFFTRAAEQYSDRPFLEVLPETAAAYDIEPATISYAEIAASIARQREIYRRSGYGPGHRVGLLLENRPAFLIHWFALNALGASVVPINPDLRASELSYLVSHSEMALAVVIPKRQDDLRRAAAASDRPLDVIGPNDAVPPIGTAYEEVDAGLDTEAGLLYTSGTTGLPKGCVLTNRYFLAAGAWYANVGGICALREGEERMLTPLPLFHMNAMAYSVMAMVATGGCLIVLDRFHPRTWWNSIRQSSATAVHYLGVMPSLLMKAPESDGDREHKVRFGFGAGIDSGLHKAFETRFGFPLVEAWAMTETGAGAVIAATHDPRKVGTNCLGRPGPDMACRIIHDDGSQAEADEAGELLVHHAGDNPREGFFDRYLKDPEATAKAWEGGWFHTGDIVRRDADGSIYFVDRTKNVIRRSGENISAVQVEGVLQSHPMVAMAGVAAVPDAIRGDEVFALVVIARSLSEAEQKSAAEELVDWSLQNLAYYKAPGYVAFVDALPLTSTQKIQRAELKRSAVSLLDAGNCVDTRHKKRRDA